VAVKVTVVNPLLEALTVFVPALGPRVSVVSARPVLFVVVLAVESVPLPVATAKATA
jgi:hypothetical protein